MSAAEQRRAQSLNRVLSGVWTPAEAAVALGRSPRHGRRFLAAYAARGPAALVHGNRVRAPANALPAAVRERAVELARTCGARKVRPAQACAGNDTTCGTGRRSKDVRQRRSQAQAAVGPVGVAVRRVPGEHDAQVPFVQDEQVNQALGAEGAHDQRDARRVVGLALARASGPNRDVERALGHIDPHVWCSGHRNLLVLKSSVRP